MTDLISRAIAAYEAELDLWGNRINKYGDGGKFEVFRQDPERGCGEHTELHKFWAHEDSEDSLHVLSTRAAMKAAIAEMRDPTIEMCIAGTEEWLCERAMEDRSLTNWQAMIDAALSEESGL
jgi:hypothetical protein